VAAQEDMRREAGAIEERLTPGQMIGQRDLGASAHRAQHGTADRAHGPD
jgi:hypothetical protein